MILTKDNKTLHLMLIAYVFFAFISPLSPALFIILCALVLLSAILLDDNSVLCFWAFASCFMSCFNFSTVFLGILDVAMGIFIARKLIESIKYKNKKNIAFICVLLAFCLICFIYSAIINLNVIKLSQSLGVIFIIAIFFLIGTISVKNIIIYLGFGLITSSLNSIIAYISGILTVSPFAFDSISSFRFGAYFSNVNALSLYCSFCQICILTLFLTQKLEFKKWFWLLVIITFIGLLSFSKTFILMTILGYGLAIFLGFIKSPNKKRYIKYFIIGLVLIAILILIFHSYIEAIIKRFYADNGYSGILNTITTGRVDIWKLYLKKWTSSPLYILFGCGITAPNIGEKTTHSFLLSLLYKFGIVGILVLVVFLVYIFKNIKSHKNLAYYLPLLIILTNGLVEDISCSLYTCLPILIALLFIKDRNIDIKK